MASGGSEAKNNPHGMDKEIWAAIKGKFDPVRAQACMNWIGEVCGESMPDQGSRSVLDWFAESLKDGYYLTKLMLTLHPDVKKNVKAAKKWKPKHSRMAFQAMESIDIFGRACKDLGMTETDVVTSQDVYQMENPNATLCCLYALNAIVQQKGWSGAIIAGSFQHATETKRNFTKEQLAAGKNTMSAWEKGSIAVDHGSSLDGAGVVKTAGTENYKANYSVQSTWEKGSLHVEGAEKVDMIVRTKANDDWHISNEVPLAAKGTINHNSGTSSVDSYGVMRKTGEN